MTVVEALHSLAFLKGMPEEVLAGLEQITTIERRAAGERLFREGDRHDEFSIIISGHVMLEMHVPGRGDLRILSLGPGDVLAWSVLVGEGRMTAGAQAIDDVTLLVFSGHTLREIAEQNDTIGHYLFRRLATALSKRLLATRLQLLDLFSSSQPPVDPGRHTLDETPPVY